MKMTYAEWDCGKYNKLRDKLKAIWAIIRGKGVMYRVAVNGEIKIGEGGAFIAECDFKVPPLTPPAPWKSTFQIHVGDGKDVIDEGTPNRFGKMCPYMVGYWKCDNPDGCKGCIRKRRAGH